MFWEARQAILEKRIKLPEDEELAKQLSSIEYEIVSDKRIKIKSKEELKSVLGRSPDQADMIAMAAYDPEYDDYWTMIKKAMG